VAAFEHTDPPTVRVMGDTGDCGDRAGAVPCGVMGLGTQPRERRVGLALLPLGLVFLTVGISTAVVFPFLSLFLSTAVHAGPVKVTVFLVGAPLAGVVASTLLGRLSDRRPIRRKLLIVAALAGLTGTAVTAFVSTLGTRPHIDNAIELTTQPRTDRCAATTAGGANSTMLNHPYNRAMGQRHQEEASCPRWVRTADL
jgi:hypothetical protein